MIRVGTRGSALARAQAQLAQAALARHGAATRLVVVETAGDRRATDTPWGEGAFVGALERGLLDRRIDLAVHSAKDMPTDEHARLRICAYLARADPRDALVVRAESTATTLARLPAGSTLGTDSPRRTAFLRARRPDVEVRPLHGNVDTRLRRLDEGAVDGLILAAAGLDRLDRGDRIGQRFAVEVLPPAPGQGAIALQARANDAAVMALAAAVDDAPTRTAVEAEREFLRATGGGCRAPIGALATLADGELRLVGGFATLDGRASAVESVTGKVEDALVLARELARRVVERRAATADHGRMLITRPDRGLDRLVGRLAELGVASVVVPAIEVRPLADDRALRRALSELDAYAWTVVTSANGARAAVTAAAGLDTRAGRWAAIGRATADALRAGGVEAAWLPARATGAAIGDQLPLRRADRVLVLRGSLADEALPRRLRERGAKVHDVVAYETVEAPAASRPLLEAALLDPAPMIVLLASPSAARGLLTLAGQDLRPQVVALPALCVGPTTAAAARELGFMVAAEAASPEAGTLAELAAEILAGAAPEFAA